MNKKSQAVKQKPVTTGRLQGERAVALMAAGEYAQALEIFEAILETTPQELSVRQQVVLCHAHLQHLEQVESLARPLLAEHPELFVVADALARVLVAQQRYQEACVVLAAAIAQPECPAFIYQAYLGLLLDFDCSFADHWIMSDWMGRHDTAPELRLGYARLLIKMGQYTQLYDFLTGFEQQVESQALEKTLRIHLYSMLIAAVMETGRVAVAPHYLELLQQAGATEAHVLRLQAQYYRYQGEVHRGIAALQRALALEPEVPIALSLLGNLLLDSGQVMESLKMHQEALRLEPENREYQHSASLTAMAASDDLRVAWRLYEGRWASPLTGQKSKLPWPEWRGEKSGGRLLLYREQGLGDEIFWASMFDELSELFDSIVYVCHHKLLTILARSFPNIIFVADAPVSHPLVFEEYDYQLPIGSLATYLRPSRSDFARGRPSFFAVDVTRAEHWRQRFALLGKEVKVGLAWRSGNVEGDRARFYPSIESLAPLLALPGVRFINLQYQVRPEEVALVHQLSAGRFHDFCEVDHFNDLDASIAMMKACEIVVSPSTSTAALAAAAGVPVLDLMAVAVEGIHLGEQHSPWLPMMTLFGKQPEAPWTESVNQVVGVVAQLVSDADRN